MINYAEQSPEIIAETRKQAIETGKAMVSGIKESMVIPDADNSDIPIILGAITLASGFDGEHATALLYGTHGTNKTRLIKNISNLIPGSQYYRFQLNADTRATDPLYKVQISTNEEGAWETLYVPKGIFTADFSHLDEVSRTPPSVQSGFMEFLAEGHSTDPDGNVVTANRHRTVFATMNEVNPSLGSYPLPLAELDRFSVGIGLPELHDVESMTKASSQYYERARAQQGLPSPKAELSMGRFHQAKDYVLYDGKSTVDDGNNMSDIHNLIEGIRALRTSNGGEDLIIGADGNRLPLVLAGLATAIAIVRGQTTVGRDDIRIAARYALPHRLELTATASWDKSKTPESITEAVLERVL